MKYVTQSIPNRIEKMKQHHRHTHNWLELHKENDPNAAFF